MPVQISLLLEPLNLFLPLNATWSSNLLTSLLHLFISSIFVLDSHLIFQMLA